MRIIFEQREELAPGIWQYFFRPDGPLDFLPGQYADLHLSNVVNDPRGASRVFSFTSLPDEPTVSFVLKHFELQSPYKQTLAKLKKGDTAKIDNAMGDLVLPKDPSAPLTFVAGGIGIASFVGMIRQLLKNNEQRKINFFYQLRNSGEKIFGDLLQSYRFEKLQISIKPTRLAAETIRTASPPESLIYLSGSQTFVENLQAGLEQLGTLRANIIFDYYDGYAEL